MHIILSATKGKMPLVSRSAQSASKQRGETPGEEVNLCEHFCQNISTGPVFFSVLMNKELQDASRAQSSFFLINLL